MTETIVIESSAPPAAPQKSSLKKGPRGKVIIFGLWCKGCKICVEFCPTDVLAYDDLQDRLLVVAPENCTACHWCDTHCPDLAIMIKKIE